MYDICLISKLIELGEILCIEREDVQSLANIMSESIGLEIMKFFKRYEELGIENDNNEIARVLKEKKEMFHEVLYDKALKYTFHLEVKERGLLDFVKRLNLNTILLITDEKEKTVKELEWLLSKEDIWIPALEVREKEDFEFFKDRMLKLWSKSQDTNITLGAKCCTNMENVINKNINYFYNRNEKKQYTGMHIVIKNINKIEEAINGLKYNIICDKSEIDTYIRRRFF